MSVIDSARNKLGELWYRVKEWARSVPPDVWIGLAIAFVTLIVVYLAYKKAGSSQSDGLSTTDPVIGTANTPGTTPLTSQDVISPGTFDVPQLWTRPSSVITGAPGTPGKPAGGLQETIAHLQAVLNQNELNGQNATIAAFNAQQAQSRAIVTSATTRDESVTAKFSSNTSSAYPTVSTAAVVTSATTRDESTIAKMIQAVKPQPKPAPAPIRPSAFTITATPTGRGVNVVY